eukprot:CAMPEP_0202962752 /NCGR_PEP_ID=MMETSP1396-20130829/6819_1 /ASSEMBLY_ACC=CAM_ASM_000872 /TAXON_ID= /ORGANISM="Pseudokeronopsis sp., Strain Brazil" /LENGTH=55 /DNA_ID=CAMNT_0049683507 /DNA_START=22 /DNA_END=186 /DNA_ORIENTATION=+
MKELVDQISAKRQDHIDHINSLKIGDLKDLRKKNYVPRKKTMEELMREVKYKKSW